MQSFAPAVLGHPRKQGRFFLTKVTLFTYASNGDANGIFYFAGKNFDPNGTWTNPSTAGRTKVVRSSNDGTSDDVIVDHAQNTDTKTGNVANSWIAMDMGSGRSAVISKYSMQLRGSNRAIRTWKFQGSNNAASNSIADLAAATWTDLDTHSGDTTMADSAFAWATFTLSPPPGAYRWFRILQNGTNAQGDNYLALDEVELYGTLNY
jgi:hypothetical protein